MTYVLNDEDIKKIPKEEQIVVIFKNKVYDVSKFVHNHPGKPYMFLLLYM